MLNEIPASMLADFMDIFSGNSFNYGTHQYNFNGDGKEEGKNATVTNTQLTMYQYKAHLSGELGLGIIPIDEKSESRFGVIDIDVYDEDLNMFITAIEESNFPLVPFRSKSGGLHIYLFLRESVNAKMLIDILNDVVTLLGLDLFVKRKLNRIVEIFPKQAKIKPGSIGSWINIPYYDADKTRQYAIHSKKKLTLDECLTYIKQKRCSLAELTEIMTDLPYKDGPPCLQTISMLPIMGANSGRNNFLFSFGVYLKKMDPEFWEQKLHTINSNMLVPLSNNELEVTIISSLRRKDYTYKCNEAPCIDYCRKSICTTRDFGIGKEGGYFSGLEYGRFVQVKTLEPYYEWEIKVIGDEKFKTIRFKNEQDLIGQDLFLRLCVRELHILPNKLKQSEWFKLVNQALTTMETVLTNQEDDTTPIGIFKQLFIEFLTTRAMAQNKQQILNKRVYHDEKAKCYYFRASDLIDFVFVAKNFRFFMPGEVHGILRDFKVAHKYLYVEMYKQIRVCVFSEKALYNISCVSEPTFPEASDDEEEDTSIPMPKITREEGEVNEEGVYLVPFEKLANTKDQF